MGMPPVSQPPKRIPYPGQVLHLGPGEWKYDVRRLHLRVERVRTDISLCYDGEWVWIEGYELDDAGVAIQRIQALVQVAALPPNAAVLRLPPGAGSSSARSFGVDPSGASSPVGGTAGSGVA